jgi:hypothetical protein
MAAEADRDRELSMLVVSAVDTVVMRKDPWEPVRLIDGVGEPVAAVTAFLRELQASGRSVATLRSYGMDLLRWFRFGWAIEVAGIGDSGGGARVLPLAGAAGQAGPQQRRRLVAPAGWWRIR